MPSYIVEAENLKTRLSSLSCSQDAGHELDSTYQMHLDEIWKTEASPLGQPGHETIKFMYHIVPMFILQPPGCEEACKEETATRFHHRLIEEPFTHGSGGSRKSCLIHQLQSCQCLLESVVLVGASGAIQYSRSHPWSPRLKPLLLSLPMIWETSKSLCLNTGGLKYLERFLFSKEFWLIYQPGGLTLWEGREANRWQSQKT